MTISDEISNMLQKLPIATEGIYFNPNSSGFFNFTFGASPIAGVEPNIKYIIHDIAHIAEYSNKEFEERSLKLGELSFHIPYNDYFQCYEGFSKLCATLREARTIAIEMHLMQIINPDFDLCNAILFSCDSVVTIVDDAHYLSIKKKPHFKQHEINNQRTNKMASLVYRFYNRLDKEDLISLIQSRFKQMSKYSQTNYNAAIC